MKLSIIIPVFNEEKSIKEIIVMVKNAEIFGWEKEIIVIDDASADGTLEILKEMKSKIPFKLIGHKKNKGKGAAIKTALETANGDYILIQDADLEYNPNDYKRLLEPIIAEKGDIVYGSRNINPKQRGYFLNFWGGKFLTFFMNMLFGSSLTDINTCYKVFRSDILKELKIKDSRFEFCEEVTAKILKSGRKIIEVPISYNPRKIEDGKKLRWFDGLIGLWTILKLKFLR